MTHEIAAPHDDRRTGARLIPAFLIAVRLALGPVLFIFATRPAAPAWILSILFGAMLSDIFDGVIARRLGIATERLRVADSWTDAWFFVWVGFSAWIAAGSILGAYWILISIEVMLQAGSYGYDLIRYRRITSLHAYSAKLWGFSLYVAAAGLLGFHTGVLIWPAFLLGLAAAVDGLAIKLILPGWQHDILSTLHALRTRECTRASGT
jgi:phosphatidylglycerophosphate synthase